MRVGMGFDAHALVPGRDLVVGGVKVPSELGLKGHSDADVLVHAIMDALLGAAALGDIGIHFPPDDPQYKDASSIELLRRVRALIDAKGMFCGNIDCVIALESPRLSPHVEAMRRNIASALAIEVSSVGVKATTTEGLGYTGRGEGAAAWAVALISSPESTSGAEPDIDADADTDAEAGSTQ